jgi:hypothetical protein
VLVAIDGADAEKAGSDQRIFEWKAHDRSRAQLWGEASATETTYVKKIQGMRGGGNAGFLACRSNLLFFRTSIQQKKAN